jgi:hypothetical protein
MRRSRFFNGKDLQASCQCKYVQTDLSEHRGCTVFTQTFDLRHEIARLRSKRVKQAKTSESAL